MKQKPTAKSDTHILGADTIYLVGKKNDKPSKPVVYDYSDRYAENFLEVDGRMVGKLNGAYAVNKGTHRLTLRKKAGGEIFRDITVYLDEDESYRLSNLFETDYNFNIFIELRGGLYFPRKSSFKNTYKIDLNAKYLSYYPSDSLELNLIGGISYLPDVKAQQAINIYPDGQMSTDLNIDVYSLVNNFVLGFRPAFLNHSTFQVGAFVSFNYASIDRTVVGTGVYTSVSELSSVGSDTYIGYGLTGSYLYDLYENLSIIMNLSYFINKPSFKVKDGSSSTNFTEVNRTYDISGISFQAGVKYNF